MDLNFGFDFVFKGVWFNDSVYIYVGIILYLYFIIYVMVLVIKNKILYVFLCNGIILNYNCVIKGIVVLIVIKIELF